MGRGKAIVEVGFDPVLEKRMGPRAVMLKVEVAEDEKVG